jgi:hypothetical protein
LIALVELLGEFREYFPEVAMGACFKTTKNRDIISPSKL